MTDTPPPDNSKSVLLAALKEIVSQHRELAALEWSYEKRVAVRKLLGLCLGFFCLCLAVFFVQLFVVGLLIKRGTQLQWIGVGGAVVNVILAIIFVMWFSRRDANMKIPFEKTRAQLKKTIEWIETLI